MLQGHFIDTTLVETARDENNLIYWSWRFMRGLTAPVFFSITGLVFTFLLLRENKPPSESKRFRKGLRRAWMLLLWGTLLKVNVFVLMAGHLPAWYYSLDVLHCIGLSLLAICGLFALGHRLRLPLWPLFLVLGIGIFLLDPWRLSLDFSVLPQVLANLFTNEYGSQFTIFPWLGYCLFGGAVGCLLKVRPQLALGHWLPLVFLLVGWCCFFHSSWALNQLYQLTDWPVFRNVAYNNYLFIRLGQVWLCFALFMWVVPRVKNIPALLPKVGSETLTIYCVHYVILYSTWFGIGISRYWQGGLDGPTAAAGALLFVLAHVFMIQWIEPIRSFIYSIPNWAQTRVLRMYRRLATR